MIPSENGGISVNIVKQKIVNMLNWMNELKFLPACFYLLIV